MISHPGLCWLQSLKAAIQRGQRPQHRLFWWAERKVNKIAVLLNLTCFSEACAWHIWVIKYKDSLLKNYASKTFSDHT